MYEEQPSFGNQQLGDVTQDGKGEPSYRPFIILLNLNMALKNCPKKQVGHTKKVVDKKFFFFGFFWCRIKSNTHSANRPGRFQRGKTPPRRHRRGSQAELSWAKKGDITSRGGQNPFHLQENA